MKVGTSIALTLCSKVVRHTPRAYRVVLGKPRFPDSGLVTVRGPGGHAREGRRIDAREQLRTAHDTFTAIGAHGFAERTRHDLLATGETVRKRRDDTRDDLTPQEEHIARLAVAGRTNPEIGTELFISPRTVEWHLNKVFIKLGITTRKALRDALPDRGLAVASHRSG